MESQKGKVWLAGGGPGDAGLLTIKTKKLIESADVIVSRCPYQHRDHEPHPERQRVHLRRKTLRQPCCPAGGDQPDPLRAGTARQESTALKRWRPICVRKRWRGTGTLSGKRDPV